MVSTLRAIEPRSATGGQITTRVASSLGARRAAWDQIVASMSDASPFVASWWIEAAAPDATHLILVEDGDRLLGGVALGVRRWLGTRRLQVLGEGIAAPDHADVVAAPADRVVVLANLVQWFAAEPHVTDLVGLRAASDLARCVGVDPGAELPWSGAPFLALTPDEVPEPRSSRVRNTVRRTRNRLVKAGYVHQRVGEDPRELDRALDDLLRLHRLRWPDGSRFSSTFEALRPVIHAGATIGAASIHEAVVDGTVVASMLVFDQPHRRSYYQSGRELSHEMRGVGTVLMADVVLDAHERSMSEFDFLRGSEPYKLDWTDDERPLVRVVGANGAWPRLLAVGLTRYERAKPALRRLRDRAIEWRTRRGRAGGSNPDAASAKMDPTVAGGAPGRQSSRDRKR